MPFSNKEDKNKIYIENADIFTNGDPQQFSSVDVNVIGEIKNEKGEVISQINPFIMILNQGAKNCQEKVNQLMKAGANPDMKIKYYGKLQSARDIAENYRNHIQIE